MGIDGRYKYLRNNQKDNRHFRHYTERLSPKPIWLDIYTVISMFKALDQNPTKFSCELDKTSFPVEMEK